MSGQSSNPSEEISLPPEGFDREALKAAMRAKLSASDAQRLTEVKTVFHGKIKLLESIQQEIFPALVRIQTLNGVNGMGFFQHSNWLVSNAHIFPSRYNLDEAILTDLQAHESKLTVQESYLRPSHRDDSPDLAIIKTDSRYEGNHKGLPTQFSDDDSYPESEDQYYVFYVDVRPNYPDDYKVHYLQLRSKKGSYPLIYECEDGSDPEPGCSGTPIIQARIVISRRPQWQFKVVEALYARCAASWYNTNPSVLTHKVPEATKLVCAVPVAQDFLQILKMLHKESGAMRAEQMAAAAGIFKDEQGEMDSVKYRAKSQKMAEEKQEAIIAFEYGVTSLNIDLPDGLEKLWYKDIVAVRDSLLIGKILDRELGKAAKKFEKRVLDVRRDELEADFENFIVYIKSQDKLVLKKGDSFLTSPAGYFRVDVGGGGSSHWILDIQDNTGKFHHQGKSLSSVFAKITVPSGSNSVTGSQLAKCFEESQRDKVAKDISLPDKDKKQDKPLKPTKGKSASSGASSSSGFSSRFSAASKPPGSVSIKKVVKDDEVKSKKKLLEKKENRKLVTPGEESAIAIPEVPLQALSSATLASSFLTPDRGITPTAGEQKKEGFLIRRFKDRVELAFSSKESREEYLRDLSSELKSVGVENNQYTVKPRTVIKKETRAKEFIATIRAEEPVLGKIKTYFKPLQQRSVAVPKY